MNNKDYIDGLKRAIDILITSADIDLLEMEDMPERLKGAKRSNEQAKLLIKDEIEMNTN